MSHRALSSQQFSTAPREGYVSEPDVSAQVNEWEPGHYYLRNLLVHREKRGQGIGTRFMHGLLAEHDRAGTQVSLHTARPELEKWYGTMGFQKTGEDEIGTRMTRRPR